MKRLLAAALTMCLMFMMAGCAKKEEKAETPVPTVQVAYAAYQFEGGYQLSEGWLYDMTISAEDQLKALNALTDGLKLTARDEMFEHGRGYHLTFADAAGNVTRELLVLDTDMVSMNGLVYDADGADALLAWLNALRIEEQDVD